MRFVAVLVAIACCLPVQAVTKKKHRKAVVTHSKGKRRVVRKHKPAVVAHPSAAALTKVQEKTRASRAAIENAAALVPFFERLVNARKQPVHILQFGDSHTASDDWVNSMRQAMQSRFGPGGPGFAFAGHPFKGYRRFDVSGSNSEGWSTIGLVGHASDGVAGLGGISIATERAGETVTFFADCATLQLFYLAQPGGASLEFSMDGNVVQTITTDGERGPGVFEFPSTPGPHTFRLRTLSHAPVRLFGWTADNTSGVTFETLGINGAQASIMLGWDEAIWASELAQRSPALVIVAYGTNEAVSRTFTPEGFRDSFAKVLDRIRAAAPLASILVVGPPDALMGIRHSRVKAPLTHIDDVVRIEREVAADHGCAFWDWRAHMGGPGIVRQWMQAGLGQLDTIHQTGEGYRLSGSLLIADLLNGYNEYVTARSQ